MNIEKKKKKSHHNDPSWHMLAPSGIWNKQTKDNWLLILSPCFLFCVCVGQGPTSPAAATSSLVPPASPTGIMTTLAPEPGFGVGSAAHPIAELKQPARPERAVSSQSSGSSSWGLEPSLPTQDLGMADTLRGFLSLDDASSYSISDGYCPKPWCWS